MKNSFLKLILLLTCFTLIGCNKKTENLVENENIKDLNKTSYINVIKTSDNKLTKVISKKSELKKLLNIINAGEKLKEDELIFYIGASYKLELRDKKDNIIYNALIYTPSNSKTRIELYKEKEEDSSSYYIEDILNIIS